MHYYDRNGKEIDQDQWIELTRDEYRRIGWTRVGPYLVSTVWIGIDMAMPITMPRVTRPLIFETMVFEVNAEGKLDHTRDMDDFMQRYPTEEIAIQGHEANCIIIKGLWRSEQDRFTHGTEEES